MVSRRRVLVEIAPDRRIETMHEDGVARWHEPGERLTVPPAYARELVAAGHATKVRSVRF